GRNDNEETLLYLANLGCIELNPWNSRAAALEKPDYMIIDLDPAGNPFDQVVEVGLIVRQVLDEACEQHYVKTSGKRGLHILIPLGAQYSYDEIKEFVKLLAELIHRRIPAITSVERSPAKRKGKIYIDYLQNRKGQTIAAPYSLRPWKGATVSTPLMWSEVKKGLDPAAFTMKTIWKRLEKHGDLMRPMLTEKIDLKESIRCLGERLKAPAKRNR
ncbi:DNA ligase, partial [Candidatus Parcubacteria bacterium]|nr:DNA ligase [Candidatus Parcubacteria bacterium]